jgi:tetratricopeptide (TPR) repeat protein
MLTSGGADSTLYHIMPTVNTIAAHLLLAAILGMAACSSVQKPSAETRRADIQGGWVHYSNGLSLKRAGEYQKAIDQFSRAAEEKSYLDLVYFQIADCHYSLFDYESALKFARMAIDANPENSKPYLLSYTIYNNLQQYPNAAESLESLLKKKPELAGVWHTLGVLYYSSIRDASKARHAFSAVLEAAAAVNVDEYYLENANFYLGHIDYAQGRPELAASHFKKAIVINPENTAAIYAIANVYMYRYMLGDAEVYAKLYLKSFPDNTLINSMLGRIYYLQERREAMPYLRKAAGDANEESKLARALYLELLHRDDEAEPALLALMKKENVYISPHVALARVSLRKSNTIMALREFFTAGVLLSRNRLFEPARRCLIKALAINDKIPDLYLNLGNVCEETGDLNQAIVYFRKAQELRPDSDLLLTIGYVYSLKNDRPQSVRYIDSVIEKEPRNPKPQFMKGLIEVRDENYPAAEKYFRRAIELNETNDNFHFYLAVSLEKQNRIDDTILALKRAVELNPANSRASNFLGYLYAEKNVNIDDSLALIRKALEYEPENSAYLDSLGWALFRKGELRHSLQKLLEAERALAEEKNPDPAVYDHVGDVYKALGDAVRAVDYWKRSLKLKADDRIERKIKESKGL